MSWERRWERRAARRYSHMTPWRPCYRTMRGPCLRCWFREVTGINRKALARHVIESRKATAHLTPIKVWRNAEGRWERR